MGKLTIAGIRSLKKPGRYADGGTLYLVVSPGGSKSFVQRLTIDGVRRDIGHGPWPETTLEEAREKAFDYRRLARKGGDPRREKTKGPTFREAALAKHDLLQPSWRNAKHAESWIQSLERHAFPTIGDMPVNRIKRRDVIDVLRPIWHTRQETARRVRQRIHAVFSYCVGMEYVEINVVDDGIDGVLSRQRAKKGQMRMLPYKEIAQFVRDLEAGPGSLVSKLCLLFTILTATRGVEAREARWDEIDIAECMWRIPGARMKMQKDHDQPLSEAAMEVLEQARALDNGSGFVFPSWNKPGSPLTVAAGMALVRDLGYGNRATVHGFRATFRTWATERTNATSRVKKLSTAHKPGDKIEEIYDRAQVLDPRRVLMDRWGCYVMGHPYSGPGVADLSLNEESLQSILKALVPLLSDR